MEEKTQYLFHENLVWCDGRPINRPIFPEPTCVLDHQTIHQVRTLQFLQIISNKINENLEKKKRYWGKNQHGEKSKGAYRWSELCWELWISKQKRRPPREKIRASKTALHFPAQVEEKLWIEFRGFLSICPRGWNGESQFSVLRQDRQNAAFLLG